MLRILYLAISLYSAYWVFNDAKRKGANFFTAVSWAVGMVVSFIIFLPLYFLFGSRKPVPRKHDDIIDVKATVIKEETKKVCQACGRTIQADYIVCPYCANKL